MSWNICSWNKVSLRHISTVDRLSRDNYFRSVGNENAIISVRNLHRKNFVVNGPLISYLVRSCRESKKSQLSFIQKTDIIFSNGFHCPNSITINLWITVRCSEVHAACIVHARGDYFATTNGTSQKLILKIGKTVICCYIYYAKDNGHYNVIIYYHCPLTNNNEENNNNCSLFGTVKAVLKIIARACDLEVYVHVEW